MAAGPGDLCMTLTSVPDPVDPSWPYRWKLATERLNGLVPFPLLFLKLGLLELPKFPTAMKLLESNACRCPASDELRPARQLQLDSRPKAPGAVMTVLTLRPVTTARSPSTLPLLPEKQALMSILFPWFLGRLSCPVIRDRRSVVFRRLMVLLNIVMHSPGFGVGVRTRMVTHMIM